MGRMSELHAAAPDALRLATEALRREVRAGGVDLAEHEDAIETLETLWQVLGLPGVPDATGGETRT